MKVRFEDFVQHHTNYEKNETKMISKTKHKEIHMDPLHGDYPEDQKNIPGWNRWLSFSKYCKHRFLDCKGIPNCKYHDSSIGYCLPKLCPKRR